MRRIIQKLKEPVNLSDKYHTIPIALTIASLFAVPLAVFIFIQLDQALNPKAQVSPAVRGQAGDLWADTIIGKPSFGEISPNETVADRTYSFRASGGLAVDKSGHLYIYDPGNNRVLGLNLADCYANSKCSADTSRGGIVIGQPNFNSSACNNDGNFQSYPTKTPASADYLCGAEQDQVSTSESIAYGNMAVDAQDNLYVVDRGNHRVVKYNTPFGGDKVADQVWGQNDFAGTDCNRSTGVKEFSTPAQNTFCFFIGGGIAIDPAGNMWVADSGNSRVLRFPKDGSGNIATIPDLVLGQSNFTSRVKGSGASQLNYPLALAFKDANTLFVADHDNNRIVKFTGPFTTGASGQVFGSGFGTVSGVAVDPAGNGIWVTNTGKGALELWNNDGTSLIKLLGKSSQTEGCNMLCNVSSSAAFDSAGNVLVYRGEAAWDVYRYDDPGANPNASIINPNKAFFTPPISANNIGQKGLFTVNGVAVGAGQMIVSDRGRIMVWNGVDSLTNGKNADYVIVDNMVNAPFNFQNGTDVGRVKVDSQNRLWVLKNSNSKELWVYQLPISASGQAPIRKIPLTLPILGGGSISWNLEDNFDNGFAFAQDGSLWLSHRKENKVVRIRNPYTSPLVDVIIGQNSVSGTQCNRGEIPPPASGTQLVASLDMLCSPGGIGLDNDGNLFVSDHSLEIDGNFRMLVFSKNDIPAGNSSLILGPTAIKSFPNKGLKQHVTFEPVFDNCNRMYVGYNGYNSHFVGIYNFPLSATTVPDIYLNDYYSQAYTIAKDSNENIYVGDLNRSRVLVYKKPSGICPGVAGELPQASPSQAPIQASSPTPTPSASPVFEGIKKGSISGTILSSAGGPAPKAKAQISIGGTNYTYSANSSGAYTIGNLSPGSYSVKYSAPKHETVSRSVTVLSGQTVTSSVVLQAR